MSQKNWVGRSNNWRLLFWWRKPSFFGWRTKEKAAFFSPKSFADGVWNNGLGVVGFVKEAGDEIRKLKSVKGSFRGCERSQNLFN